MLSLDDRFHTVKYLAINDLKVKTSRAARDSAMTTWSLRLLSKFGPCILHLLYSTNNLNGNLT